MKTVGIIGGLGPETTAKFYIQLLKAYRKLEKKFRPEILIDSLEMDLEIEEAFINGEDRSKEYIGLLTSSAKKLEASGADFLTIPCNTVHIFIDEIRSAVKIPVLSIVEETINFLHGYEIGRVGLLATTQTVNANLYNLPLEIAGVEVQTPSNIDQDRLGKLINRLVRNEYSNLDKSDLIGIIDNLLQKEVEMVLLACTDFQLLAPIHPKIAIYDTMNILVEATAREMNKL